MSETGDEETREENLKDEDENKEEEESEKRSKKKLHDEGNISNVCWCYLCIKQNLNESNLGLV